MKRLLILLACCLLLCTAVFAQEPVITNLKTDCVVESSGTCKITQNFNLSIDEAQKELSFPLGTGVKNASVAGYKARKTNVNGTDTLVLKSGSGFVGNRSFTVTYTLKNLVVTENGIQTLTLPMLCADWPWQINAYEFTVTMPQDFIAQPTFESGYSGDVIEDYMDISTQNNVIHGTLSQTLRDHESMTMRLDVDDGYFSRSRETWKGGSVGIILAALCLILGVVYWFFTLRSPKMKASSRSMPPDSAQPGDLPYLLCCKKPHFNAMVLHWASLGYLTIVQDEHDNVTLVKNMEMGSERRKYECKLFEMLFSEGEQIDGTSTLFKQTAKKAENAIPRFWQKRLYARTSGNVTILRILAYITTAISVLTAFAAILPEITARGFVLFLTFLVGLGVGYIAEKIAAAYYLNEKVWIGISGAAFLALIAVGRISDTFACMLIAIIMLAFTSLQTVHGGKRSEYGTNMIEQALGFHRYMNKLTDSRVKALQAQDPQYLYRMLPYAVAMNCGDALVQNLGEADVEPCEYFRDPHQMRTVSEFYTRLLTALGTLDFSINK